MSIIKRNLINVSDLKLRLDWQNKDFITLYRTENLFTIMSEFFKETTSTRSKALGLLGFLFLTVILFMIFPIFNKINVEERIFSSIFDYIILISISMYLAWFSICIFDRYNEMKEKKSPIRSLIRISDLIIPIIGLGTWIAYKELSKLEINPIFYFMEVTINELDLDYVSNLFIFFIIVFVIVSVLTPPMIIIFNVWVNPAEKMKEIMKYGEEKNFKFKLNTTKGLQIRIFSRSFNLINPSKLFELTYIPPNVEILKCWQVIHPYYLSKVLMTIMFSSFLLSYGFLFSDLIVSLNGELLNAGSDFTTFFFIIVGCAVVFLTISLILLYNHVFKPIYDYHLLRKKILKELTKKIDEVYEDEELNSEAIYLIFLQDCLNRIKQSPVLPLNKVYSLLFFLTPFFGPIILLIF